MIDRPLCFVLMPFGRKKDPLGGPEIDFDRIYEDGIRPGIDDAGMEPIRADEERTGGIIHKAMFERLLLCDFAVADLTTGNANVFYEIGVRHAARPATTLAIFANTQQPPFDVNFLRALPYKLAESNRFGSSEAALLRASLGRRLRDLRAVARDDAVPDSPVFQLLQDYAAPDIARLKTDVFRERVRYSAGLKSEMAEARERRDVGALDAVQSRLGSLDAAEVGVLVDLFLSYRAVQAWDKMVKLYGELPASLERSVMMREQAAFARNRLGQRREAVRILEDLVREHGATSETLGILGRVYKDLWVDARKAGNESLALGYLDRAIETYVRGFEADSRDAYPGINALTLLDIKGDEESLRRGAELLPVVRFAVLRRIKIARPDYWDFATLLELAVLANDETASQRRLSEALSAMREPWEAATTANNLAFIRDARQKRGKDVGWLDGVIESLNEASRSTARR